MKKLSRTLLFAYLILGIFFKLYLTSGGHFIFHMDIARDFLDIREMFLLHKLRLIGPPSAIDGLFTGPLWYYLLSIPYLLSSGNPYSGVVLIILAWAIGGYFLIKLISSWGVLPIFVAASLWLGSDLIKLATSYSFHPNLITLLSPVFIFCLVKYLETQKLKYLLWSVLLGGSFFQFEMNYGVFIPPIIISTVFICKRSTLKNKIFWFGLSCWFITLLPQIIFDLRNHFLMSKSLLSFLQHQSSSNLNLSARAVFVLNSFYNIFAPVLLNSKFLTNTILVLLTLWILKTLQQSKKPGPEVVISTCMIFIPFFGFLIIPVNINSWHLGTVATAFIILVAFSIKYTSSINRTGKIISLALVLMITLLSISHIQTHLQEKKLATDPSLFLNETRAIDFIYNQASGQNFRVYTYLPSVYDYPYQYLFPWYGLKKYGYLPKYYAYLPNKPDYIKAKDNFPSSYPPDSSLIFLIKEPDNPQRRELWENNFKAYPLLKIDQVGPLAIETHQDINL